MVVVISVHKHIELPPAECSGVLREPLGCCLLFMLLRRPNTFQQVQIHSIIRETEQGPQVAGCVEIVGVGGPKKWGGRGGGGGGGGGLKPQKT